MAKKVERQQAEQEDTMQFMHESATSFSFNGEQFAIGADGVFDLPVEAAEDALVHGFVLLVNR